MSNEGSATTVRNRKVPEGLRNLLGEANSKFLAKQYGDAKKRCEWIIERHSKLPDPYHLLGLIYKELGHEQAALSLFKLAAKYEYDSADYELWIQVAEYAEEIGDKEAAFDAYKTAASKIKHTRPKGIKTEKSQQNDEFDGTKRKSAQGYVADDYYHGCNFEAYEKVVVLAEELNDLQEACKALRFMMRNMKKPSLLHLQHFVHLLEKRNLTPHQMATALKSWIEPLLFSLNDSRNISHFIPVSPTAEEITECKIFFRIFEKFLLTLIHNKHFNRALGYILRFKKFLQTPTYGRWNCIHSIKPLDLPPFFISLQAACLIQLNNLEAANSLRQHLFDLNDEQGVKLDVRVFLILSEAYYIKCLYTDSLLSLGNTRDYAYHRAVVLDASGKYKEAIKYYGIVLRYKAPVTGKEDFQIYREFTNTTIDKKAIASRLFELYWTTENEKEANKIFTKYLTKKDATSEVSKDRLVRKLLDEKERQEIIDKKIPRLLDPNYSLPQVRRKETIDGEIEFEVITKRRKIFKAHKPMSLALSLRQTSNKATSLNVDLRPYSLQRISRCEACLENKDYRTCLRVGLDLVYPYFGNGEVACPSYQKLVDEFPPEDNTPDTKLVDDEIMRVFKCCVAALRALNKLTDGVNLAVDLYKSTFCSFVKLEDNSECFAYVIYLCLISQDFENLAKLITTLITDYAVNQPNSKANQDLKLDTPTNLGSTFSKPSEKLSDDLSVERCRTLLNILQYVLQLHPENKNLPRIMKRLINAKKESKNPKILLTINLLCAFTELERQNKVRALRHLLHARKICPENAFINLFCSICYLGISTIRTNKFPKKCVLQGAVYLKKYAKFRMLDKDGNIDYELKGECDYNSAVYFHKIGFKFLAENLYIDVLKNNDCPRPIKSQAAFGVATIYRKSNPDLARRIIKFYNTI